MKNRFIKPLTVVLALALLLPVFMLGCTDKKDKPRTLDSVEQSIVGTWKNEYNTSYTFKSDGTYEISNGEHGEFKHAGDGIETDGEARGHYEVIETKNSRCILFDIYQDKLMPFSRSSTTIYATNGPETLTRQ